MNSNTTSRHRNKVAVAWMASVFGLFGLHWWYLGRRYAWLLTLFSVLMLSLSQFYPVWWDNIPFLLLLLPVSAGIIEAIVFALTPDQKFDQRYNQGSEKQTKTGWNAVMAAIITAFVGGPVIIFGIALVVIHVYKAMGWLDEYIL